MGDRRFMNKRRVICVGEVLWDALPAGLYLGGAPLNVCYHLNQLGIDATIASKVGDDRLGEEALRRIKNKGISTKYVQQDKEHETGFVKVQFGEYDNEPSYDIIKPVAWDFIQLTTELENLIKNSWGFVFGSLAQRHEISRQTIQHLWEYEGKKILDLNIRAPYINKDIVFDSLKVADIVKVNEEELNQLKEWYSFPDDNRKAVKELTANFNCSLVCITCGPDGAWLYQDNSWYEHSGYRIKAEDTIGAGDAFLAALICGLQNDKYGENLLAYGNAAGSLVAQKNGATPEYNMQDIEKIITSG